MTFMTTAGSIIAVTATAPATFDEAGFEAATFTVVGEVTDLGETGRVYNKVEHNPIGSRATQKRKGGFDPGNQNFVVALDRADAGQIIMQAAAQSDDDYYFKLTEQDGTVNYYAAQVMGFRINRGTRDNIVTATTTLEVQAKGGVDFIVVEPA